MKYPPVPSRTVLVTGCSTGIGAATALWLKERGWTVFPTARKPDDLENLRRTGFTPIEMDMSDADSVARGADQVLTACDGALGAVVNNAGYGQSGAVEDVAREHLRRQFEVNVFGLQDLTNRLLPAMRQQGAGRVVHISSVVGQLSVPYLGVYSASKFAVEALADAQRVELRDTGIAVSLVEPGPIVTEFRRTCARAAEETLDLEASRNADLYRSELERRAKQPRQRDGFSKSPQAVAMKIAHALESARPRRRYFITLHAYTGFLARRFVPAALIDASLAVGIKLKR